MFASLAVSVGAGGKMKLD